MNSEISGGLDVNTWPASETSVRSVELKFFPPQFPSMGQESQNASLQTCQLSFLCYDKMPMTV